MEMAGHHLLIDALGDSGNLRVLSFFFENPKHAFSVSRISRMTQLTRQTTSMYITEFVVKDYLIKEMNGTRTFYRLNRNNHVIALMERMIDDMGQLYSAGRIPPARELLDLVPDLT
jgi:hypothetical protein